MSKRYWVGVWTFGKVDSILRDSDGKQSQGGLAAKLMGGMMTMLFGKVAISLLGFLQRIVLARILGPAGLGTYGVIFNATSLIGMILNCGLQNMYVHEIGKGRMKSQEAIGFAVSYVSIVGLVAILFFWVLGKWDFRGINFLDPVLGNDLALLFISLTIPFNILFLQISHILVGLRFFKSYNVVVFVEATLFVALLSTWPEHSWKPITQVFAVRVISLGMTVLGLIIYLSYVHKSKPVIRLGHIGRRLTYGVRAVIVGVSYSLVLQVNLYVAAYLLHEIELGIYYLAYNIFEMMSQITTMLGIVLVPHSTVLDIEKSAEMTNTMFRLVVGVSLFSVFFAIPAIYFGIDYVFGKEYLDSRWPLIFLIPGAIFGGLIRVLYSFFMAQNWQHRVVDGYILALVVSGLSTWGFVRWLGIIGASAGLSIGLACGLVTVLLKYTRLTKSSITDVVFMNQQDWIRIRDLVRDSNKWMRKKG